MVDTRHLPALAAVIALATTLAGVRVPLVVVALVATVWSIALAVGPLVSQRARLLTVSLAVGLSVGGLSSVRLALLHNPVFVGLEEQRITRIEGVAAEDSRPWGADGVRARIFLSKVGDRDSSVSAFGSVTMLSTGSSRFGAGARLSIDGRVDRDARGNLVIRASSIGLEGYGSDLLFQRNRLRGRLLEAFDRIGYPASGLFAALILGDRSRIPAQMNTAFEQTGTTHILALSGLHVGIVLALVGLVLLPLGRHWMRSVTAAVILAAYLFVAGLSPSLTRAALVVVAVATTRHIGRRLVPISVLGLALVGHLIVAPQDAFSLSFTLSYGAFAGIVSLGPSIARTLGRWLPRPLVAPVALTLGAQIPTLPLVLYAFGLYRPISILATLLALPVITAFVWIGMLWLPLAMVPIADRIGPPILDTLSRVLVAGGSRLARVPPIRLGWGYGVLLSLAITAAITLGSRRKLTVEATGTAS